MQIYTIGHSTRTLDQFLSILVSFGIEQLVDIRTVPRSRYNPQYNQDTFPNFLAEHNIKYIHMKGLGGFRRPNTNSANQGLRSEAFSGFADYMQTPEFQDAISRLIEISLAARTAIMCAEAVPWRCHRFLIADTLTVRSVEVIHIMDIKKSIPHTLSPTARIENGHLVYP